MNDEVQSPREDAPGEGGQRSFALRNVLVGIYLLVQAILPLNGFLHDKLETRGDFSWNMYAQMYSCSRRYVLVTPDGRGQLLDLADFFATDIGSTRVCHEDRLQAFHDWLCEDLARQGRAGVLKAGIEGTLNGAEPVPLIERYTDLCTIELQP